MCSKSQNNHNKGNLAWENLGKGEDTIKGMKPQKIQERDWIGGGPSTTLEKPRNRLDSFERQSAYSLNQENKWRIRKDLSAIAASLPTLYIPEGVLFLFTPINLATTLELLCACPFKFFS